MKLVIIPVLIMSTSSSSLISIIELSFRSLEIISVGQVTDENFLPILSAVSSTPNGCNVDSAKI